MRLRRCAAVYLIILGTVLLSRGLLWAAWGGPLAARYAISGGDYVGAYVPVARAVVEGRGFADPRASRLYTLRPPGYPAYLAAGLVVADGLGVELAPVRLAMDNLLVVPLTALGLVVFWEMLGVGAAWAVAAALAYALYPPYVWGGVVPLTLPLFTLLLVWGCVAWGRATRRPESVGWHCAAGAALGATMLVRPNLVLMPAIALIVLLWRRRGWRPILGFAACVLVTAGPWILAASLAEGRFVPLSTMGRYAIRDGMSRLEGNPVADAYLAGEGVGSGPAGLVPFGVRQLVAHPLASASLWAQKLARAWYGTDHGGRVEWALAAVNLPILALGALGWARLRAGAADDPARRRLTADMLGLVLYFWLATATVVSILRYMVPVMWVPVGFGLLALQWGIGRLRDRGTPAAPP